MGRLLGALLVTLLLASCSAKDYHLAMLSESFRASSQAEHLNGLHPDDARGQMRRVCVYYPAGMGGYSAGCRDESLPQG